jgi:hypothetical protein
LTPVFSALLLVKKAIFRCFANFSYWLAAGSPMKEAAEI